MFVYLRNILNKFVALNKENNMKAIILAAGRGSRMGKLTSNKPKCLTLLNKRPMIEHQIFSLQNAGIKDIAIVTGYKSKMLDDYKLKKFHNARWNNTNMVYSLFCAWEWLKTSTCIVSYSDIFYSSRIVKDLMLAKADAAVAL